MRYLAYTVAIAITLTASAATGQDWPVFEVYEPISRGFESNCVEDVAVGDDHSCALQQDGSVTCWGDDTYGQSSPPRGQFFDITAGGDHTCGIRYDGTVECWGRNNHWQASPPSGDFTQIDAGRAFTCGVHPDNSVTCWGLNFMGSTSPRGAAIAQVSAGVSHSCGVTTNDWVSCWGRAGRSTPPFQFHATEVSAGRHHTCAISNSTGRISCWGNLSAPRVDERFIQLDAYDSHACGVTDNNEAVCWGGNGYGQSSPPRVDFNQVAVGLGHTCGVTSRGTVECWGNNQSGQSESPLAEVACVQVIKDTRWDDIYDFSSWK